MWSLFQNGISVLKVKINGIVVETDTISANGNYEFELSTKLINRFGEGNHTISIEVTDSYSISDTISITYTRPATTIVISGEDSSLGEVWLGVSLAYIINDTSSENVIAYEYTNGEITKTIPMVELNKEIEFDMSKLVLGHNVIQIKAIDGSGSVSWREYTVVVLNTKLVFQTNPVLTDEAANNIVVNMIHDTTGEPTVKIEVTNNASASEPTWEDMTQEWMQNKAYTFQNKPSEDYGVAVRVTLEKNENTKYVYVNGLGFSYS